MLLLGLSVFNCRHPAIFFFFFFLFIAEFSCFKRWNNSEDQKSEIILFHSAALEQNKIHSQFNTVRLKADHSGVWSYATFALENHNCSVKLPLHRQEWGSEEQCRLAAACWITFSGEMVLRSLQNRDNRRNDRAWSTYSQIVNSDLWLEMMWLLDEMAIKVGWITMSEQWGVLVFV